MYEYKNSFHHSRTTSKYEPDELRRAKEVAYAALPGEQDYRLHRQGLAGAYAALKRINRKLCGVEGCTCKKFDRSTDR